MVKVKNKKRNLAEVTAKKREHQKKKSMNAFEVHINKEKHKVLGRKNKADRGLPGVARSKALNKRKNTLLHEYKVRDKNNTFLDRRIGERNSAMTQEDKVMARFAAERIKAHKKKNIFNLNDEEVLTHRGQTLAEIEKFDDPRSDDEEYSDDENKTGKLDKDFVSEAHFGGGVLSKSDGSMSRKDLIEQLIAESKKRKAEKQKLREQTLDLTEKLDTEWKDLLPIVNASKKRTEETFEKPKADDYDIALRELKFEARGTPSDRLKSEEEIAKEEKEKLESLEADRLARMKGFTENSNSQTKHKSADDLDDGFFIEDVNEDTLTYGEDGLVKDGSAGKKKESLDINGDNASSAESGRSESDEDENEEDDSEDEVEKDSNESIPQSQMLDAKKNADKDVQSVSENQTQYTKTLNTQTKSLDPYDNIPVLKISDDNQTNEAKINKNLKTSNNATVSDKRSSLLNKDINILKTTRSSDTANASEPENLESEEDSGAEESSDEGGSDEDNLSDLKEADSSSEADEEPSPNKNVKFSLNLEQKKIQTGKQSLVPSKSILKSVKDELCEAEKLSAEERSAQIKLDLLRRKEVMEKAREELPYTYNAPESFEELWDLLQQHNADYQSVIVERIIKCNHQSLGQSNKEKLANLFSYLIQHLNTCATEAGENDVVNCFQIFDRLCPHLYDLAHANPENAETCIQDILKEKHEKFEQRQKRYPGIDILLIFKLVSLLFPTSDYRHPVATPALVFMSQILTRCRVRNRSDIAKGLFICTLVLEYSLLSKRFSPSVINYLRGIIHMSTPKPCVQIIKTIPPFKSTGELSNLLIIDTDKSDMKIHPKSNLMLAADLVVDQIDDDFRIRTFLTAVNLVSEFKTQLEELEAVYSIFEPTIRLLDINRLVNYPENVRQYVRNVLEDLNTLKDKKLEYITREKKKPKALRLYEPRIETVYDGKKHRPMSKEKAELEKLRHKYKREVKGAVRELRKDQAVLAKVQIKQQIRSDEDRKRKVKEIFGHAALQQGELNKIKRTK